MRRKINALGIAVVSAILVLAEGCATKRDAKTVADFVDGPDASSIQNVPEGVIQADGNRHLASV